MGVARGKSGYALAFTCNECPFRYSNYAQFTNHKKSDCPMISNVEFVSYDNSLYPKQEMIELNEDPKEIFYSDDLTPQVLLEDGDRETDLNDDVIVNEDLDITKQTESLHDVVELIDETNDVEEDFTNKNKSAPKKEKSIHKRGKLKGKLKSTKTHAVPEPAFSCKDCGFKYSDFAGFILHKKEDCY
jgi:predicted Zn-ribbon and HTH transcriptional regulator